MKDSPCSSGTKLLESYLVRIYRRNRKQLPDAQTEILGTVEYAESGERVSFTDPDELWNILTKEKIGSRQGGRR
ncbi:MAG: hypothetical protein KKE17_15400 [Proteobacteria bacterium]|nr:hypothetical protein [Pseudomonadota bacterium]MBU1711386.1 hypothetical protein [Pseudomonadota bacterium]